MSGINLKDEISSISRPALIIYGKEDLLIPLSLAEEIHESIKHSRFEIIENSSHNVFIPQGIPLLLEMITSFLKE